MFILKIRGSVPGWHYWPDAPEKYAALRTPHGHNFGFELLIPEETAREIEFLELANQCVALLAVYTLPSSSMSCEELAEALYDWAEAAGLQPLTAEVNEDGLCGAVYYKEGED